MRIYLSVWAIFCLVLNCLFLIPLNGQVREMIRPMECPLLLSGNFGELRATHFHAGIDIRTGGVTGIPVVSVLDGRVVRVRVSPVGYGLALYVEHPGGTTTVYGHLSRVVPRLSEVVRELQYKKKSFDIDEDLRAYNLQFKQGDVIAYSGNSGSSGGPHLHFEIRDTKSEKVLNPLGYYKIKDVLPPKIRMIYIYGVSELGQVEMLRQVALKTVSPGHYSGGRITIPAGKIGMAVFAEDYMGGSVNKLGVYKIDMAAGGKNLFQMKMDTCSFDQSCFINEMKDFYQYKKRETVYRCFGNYQCQVVCVQNRDCGLVHLAKDSTVDIVVHLADINGNRSEVTFKLRGGAEQKKTETPDEMLIYGQAYQLETQGCLVELDSAALLSSVKKTLKVVKDTVSERNVFWLSETEVPLIKKASLTLFGNFSYKTVICEVDSRGRKYPLATSRNELGVSAEIGYLSRYTTVEDLLPPSITYLGVSPDRQVRFKIKDNLTGIAEYRGEVNGEWCLFMMQKMIFFPVPWLSLYFKKGKRML